MTNRVEPPGDAAPVGRTVVLALGREDLRQAGGQRRPRVGLEGARQVRDEALQVPRCVAQHGAVPQRPVREGVALDHRVQACDPLLGAAEPTEQEPQVDRARREPRVQLERTLVGRRRRLFAPHGLEQAAAHVVVHRQPRGGGPRRLVEPRQGLVEVLARGVGHHPQARVVEVRGRRTSGPGEATPVSLRGLGEADPLGRIGPRRVARVRAHEVVVDHHLGHVEDPRARHVARDAVPSGSAVLAHVVGLDGPLHVPAAGRGAGRAAGHEASALPRVAARAGVPHPPTLAGLVQGAVRIVAGGAGHLALGEAAREDQALHVADEAHLLVRLGRHEQGPLLEQVTARRRRAEGLLVEHEARVPLQVAGGADRELRPAVEPPVAQDRVLARDLLPRQAALLPGGVGRLAPVAGGTADTARLPGRAGQEVEGVVPGRRRVRVATQALGGDGLGQARAALHHGTRREGRVATGRGGQHLQRREPQAAAVHRRVGAVPLTRADAESQHGAQAVLGPVRARLPDHEALAVGRAREAVDVAAVAVGHGPEAVQLPGLDPSQAAGHARMAPVLDQLPVAVAAGQLPVALGGAVTRRGVHHPEAGLRLGGRLSPSAADERRGAEDQGSRAAGAHRGSLSHPPSGWLRNRVRPWRSPRCRW